MVWFGSKKNKGPSQKVSEFLSRTRARLVWRPVSILCPLVLIISLPPIAWDALASVLLLRQPILERVKPVRNNRNKLLLTNYPPSENIYGAFHGFSTPFHLMIKVHFNAFQGIFTGVQAVVPISWLPPSSCSVVQKGDATGSVSRSALLPM